MTDRFLTPPKPTIYADKDQRVVYAYTFLRDAPQALLAFGEFDTPEHGKALICAFSGHNDHPEVSMFLESLLIDPDKARVEIAAKEAETLARLAADKLRGGDVTADQARAVLKILGGKE